MGCTRDITKCKGNKMAATGRQTCPLSLSYHSPPSPPLPPLPSPPLPSPPPFHSYTLLTSLSSDATLTTPWSTCAATLSPSPLGSLAPTRVQPFRDTPTAHVLTAPQGQGMSSNTEPTATSVHCWGRGKGGAGGGGRGGGGGGGGGEGRGGGGGGGGCSVHSCHGKASLHSQQTASCLATATLRWLPHEQMTFSHQTHCPAHQVWGTGLPQET